MKPIHAVLLRKLLISKPWYVFILVLLVLTGKVIMRAMYGGINSNNDEFALEIYYGIINGKSIQVLIIPFFLLLAGLVSNLFDSYKVLLRYHSAKQWWKEKMFGTGLFMIIYMLIINAMIFGAVIVSGHAKDISSDFVGFILLGIVMQIAGLLIVGTFYHLVTLGFSNQYLGFFVTILLVFLVDFLRLVFRLELITLEEYMSLMYKLGVAKFIFVAGDLVPVFWLIFVFIGLYSLGSTLAQNKDFYWSD